MLSIDEAIAFERQQAKDRRNEHYTFGIQKSKEAAEEHEQLAEWLEELKAYREKKCNKSVYLASKSVDKIDAVNKGYIDGYNKAIDEFVKKICVKYTEEERKGNYKQYCVEIKQSIADLAEQLKERNNENYNKEES